VHQLLGRQAGPRSLPPWEPPAGLAAEVFGPGTGGLPGGRPYAGGEATATSCLGPTPRPRGSSTGFGPCRCARCHWYTWNPRYAKG